MTVKLFMVPVYGRLVMYGRMTVDPQNNELKQVPEIYVPYVCEWLAEHGV